MRKALAIACLAALGALGAALPALAAEEISIVRHWWDFGWRIANFLILAFLIYKLGKQPLLDFLRGQRSLVELEENKLRKAKQEALAEQRALNARMSKMAATLKEFEEGISIIAAKQRGDMLADAKTEAALILDRAELWARQALADAKRQLAEEMLGQAGEIAAQKLAEAVTAEDRAKFFAEFEKRLQKTRV